MVKGSLSSSERPSDTSVLREGSEFYVTRRAIRISALQVTKGDVAKAKDLLRRSSNYDDADIDDIIGA